MRIFCASDFDGTLAKTFEKSPNGIGVEEAYSLALRELVGPSGPKLFEEIGGLMNRSSGEIVDAILRLVAERGDMVKVTNNVHRVFQKRARELRNYVPKGKGRPLNWDDPLPTVMTELLVRIKLAILMKEIGQRFSDNSVWPRPAPGLGEFLSTIRTLSKRNGTKVTLAVLSSGHDAFIRKCFRTWGMTCPVHILTDDEMRRPEYDKLSADARVKPSAHLFSMLVRKWRAKLLTREEKQYLYVGDCQEKDGKLAQRTGVPFLWFNPKGQRFTGKGRRCWSFSDWSELARFFSDPRVVELLGAGKPVFEILRRWRKVRDQT